MSAVAQYYTVRLDVLFSPSTGIPALVFELLHSFCNQHQVLICHLDEGDEHWVKTNLGKQRKTVPICCTRFNPGSFAEGVIATGGEN